MRYFRNPDVKNLCLLLGLVTLGATIAGFLAGVGTGYLVLLVCLLFCGICLGHTLWRHRQMERLADYLRRITAVSRMNVYVGGAALPIGRTYKDAFTEAFSRYMAKKEWEDPCRS